MTTLIVRMNHMFTMRIEHDAHNTGDIISIIHDFYNGFVEHEDDETIEVEMPGGTLWTSSMYDSFNNTWDLYIQYPGDGPEWVASFRMNA